MKNNKDSEVLRLLKRKTNTLGKVKKPTIKHHVPIRKVGWDLPREFLGMYNPDNVVIKRAAMKKVATLDKTGRNFLKDTLDLKVTGRNRNWVTVTNNFQTGTTLVDGFTVQERISRRLEKEKETVPVWDKKTGDFKKVTRTITEHTKKWAIVDAIIPMGEKEAQKVFRNLGFEVTRWIKNYGEKWKIEMARHILDHQNEYGKFMVADALRYLAYAKNKRAFHFTEFEFKKLYNKKKHFIGQEVPLFKVVNELLEKNFIDRKEIAKIHQWALNTWQVPAWQHGYYTYKNLDTSKLTELLGKPNNSKLIDILDRDFKYRLGDMHRYNAREKGLDDPYFGEWKKEHGEGYEDLIEYIEQNPKNVVLSPNNVLSLASSENFHEVFFKAFDFKWGATETRKWLDENIIMGKTAYKNLSNRVYLRFMGTKLRKFDEIWKIYGDDRFEEALQANLEALNPNLEGYIKPTIVDKKLDAELEWDYNPNAEDEEEEEEEDEDDEEEF